MRYHKDPSLSLSVNEKKMISSVQCQAHNSAWFLAENASANTWRSLSSFSVIKALIWKTKENMAMARKKVGPALCTAEKISSAGWANSLRLTTQLKLASEIYVVDKEDNSGQDKIRFYIRCKELNECSRCHTSH